MKKKRARGLGVAKKIAWNRTQAIEIKQAWPSLPGQGTFSLPFGYTG
jgi:hypothetical protein